MLVNEADVYSVCHIMVLFASSACKGYVYNKITMMHKTSVSSDDTPHTTRSHTSTQDKADGARCFLLVQI